jgi:hypothetical protein
LKVKRTVRESDNKERERQRSRIFFVSL